MAWYNPTDPQQRNMMVGGIVALLLVVPFTMYLVTPKQEANAIVQTRLDGLNTQNLQAGVILAQGGGDLEERMALYERHVARLEQLIPAQEEVANLLNDIQTQARLVNVEVQSLDPEPTDPAGPYDVGRRRVSRRRSFPDGDRESFPDRDPCSGRPRTRPEPTRVPGYGVAGYGHVPYRDVRPA